VPKTRFARRMSRDDRIHFPLRLHWEAPFIEIHRPRLVLLRLQVWRHPTAREKKSGGSGASLRRARPNDEFLPVQLPPLPLLLQTRKQLERWLVCVPYSANALLLHRLLHLR